MTDEPLRLLILGAHPDDAEFHAGGLAAIYRDHDHAVKMVSLTSGEVGHHRLSGPKAAFTRAYPPAGQITSWRCGSPKYSSTTTSSRSR